MSHSFSLEQQAKISQSLKQTQRMIMSPQMQQAIHLLQLPLLELANKLEAEMAQNPVLELSEESPAEDQEHNIEEEEAEESLDEDFPPERELSFSEKDFEILKQIDEEFRDYFSESGSYTAQTAEEEKLKSFQMSSIQAEMTLFEHLMNLASQSFTEHHEIDIAEALIGNFDARGFLKTPLSEIALLTTFSIKDLQRVLKEIQTFEPFGVGAQNLQESFLIQLRCLRKEKTLAYQIIDLHYQDLLHNRLLNIKKNLGCSLEKIKDTIREEISKLDLNPGTCFSHESVQTIVPDAQITEDDGTLHISVSSDFLPPIRLNKRYMHMLEDPSLPFKTHEFIRQHIVSAKWLLRNVEQRNSTIERITSFLATYHAQFFLSPAGQLVPLTMKVVAENLNLHESTIARAVSGKYVETPRGIFPFRFFFTNAYLTSEGTDISSETVRNTIQTIIEKEDKSKPLSDHKISEKLRLSGIECARRTIAKYRGELNIGNAQQRRSFAK
ncbi:MAG: RNA polymerase sigma-54 factor [Parachlamydia sp.]|nr:MAG: RNA polymerase sigma-54 factor [Parachlamydia sp.]